MKLKLLGAILFSLICWAIPITVWAKTATQPKLNTQTEIKTEQVTPPRNDVQLPNTNNSSRVSSLESVPKNTKPKTAQPSSYSGRHYSTPQASVESSRPSFNEREIARALLPEYGWEEQWVYLDSLWSKESGWQAGRLNHSSFACGIPQALPCTKIYPSFHQMERVWINGKLFLKSPDPEKEIRWGLNYIANRYGTPTQAIRFHQSHNWY